MTSLQSSEKIDRSTFQKRVIIDEREKPSGIPDLLINLEMDVELRMLDIGDYVVSPECCIERKEKRDFIQSLYSGRLFSQINRISKVYPQPILIVEGDITEKDPRIKSKVFWGALASMIFEYNLNVLFTKNIKQTADLIFTLTKHANSSETHKRAPLYRRSLKNKDLGTIQLLLVSSLPGIGIKLSERILKRYKSIRKIFSASVAELSLIDGIGRIKAEKIVETLNSPYLQNREVAQQLRLDKD